jgi:hypothetical protein
MEKEILQHLEKRKQIRERIINNRLRILDFIYTQYPGQKAYVDYCLEEIKTVAVILGSARGGTSAFKDTLAASSALISMTGEHRLFFTLWGYNFPDHGGELEHNGPAFYSPHHPRLLLGNIFYDSNHNENWNLTEDELELYGWEWALRLQLQWPEHEFDAEQVVPIVCDCYKKIPDFTPAHIDAFYVNLIETFKKKLYPRISHLYYDFSQEVLARYQDDEPPESFYRHRTIIEITPFVLTRPRKLKQIPPSPPILLLKASSDCYRVPLLRLLLEGRQIYYLHLTRNPLSSVNGLIDGWFHPCFGQHDLNVFRDMYKLQHEDREIDRYTWKFDLYEEWRENFHQPLDIVSILQWMSSHDNISREMSRLSESEHYLRIAFEDFQRDVHSRTALYRQVCRFLEIGFDASLENRVLNTRIVNATFKPQLQRWKKKRDLLVPLLKHDGVASHCQNLGYDTPDYENWI